MKTLTLITFVLFAGMACAHPTGPTVKLPWECMSHTPPQDAEVLRFENGMYIYDCLWNGDGDGDSDGGDDGND